MRAAPYFVWPSIVHTIHFSCVLDGVEWRRKRHEIQSQFPRSSLHELSLMDGLTPTDIFSLLLLLFLGYVMLWHTRPSSCPFFAQWWPPLFHLSPDPASYNVANRKSQPHDLPQGGATLVSHSSHWVGFWVIFFSNSWSLVDLQDLGAGRQFLMHETIIIIQCCRADKLKPKWFQINLKSFISTTKL